MAKSSTALSFHEELFGDYQKLPEEAAAILELLSVCYRVENQTDLTKLVSLSALRARRSSRAFTMVQIKTSLKQLEKDGFIYKNHAQINVLPGLADLIVHSLTENAPEKLKRIDNAVQARAKQENRFFFNFYSTAEGLIQTRRDLRSAYLSGDDKALDAAFDNYSRHPKHSIGFWEFVNTPFQLDRFLKLPELIKQEAFTQVHHFHLQEFIPGNALLESAESTLALSPQILSAHAEHLILSGRFEEAADLAEKILKQPAPGFLTVGLYINGWLAFIKHQDDEAIDFYEQALKESLRGSKKRKAFPFRYSGLFFILALCRRGTAEDINRAKSIYDWGIEFSPPFAITPIEAIAPLLSFKLGDESAAIRQIENMCVTLLRESPPTLFAHFIELLNFYWIKPELLETTEIIKRLFFIIDQCRRCQFNWIETEAIKLLLITKKEGANRSLKKRLLELRKDIGGVNHPLISLIPHMEKWDRSLSALESLGQQSSNNDQSTSGSTEPEKKLMWLLVARNYYFDPEEEKTSDKSALNWVLTPFEQSRLKSGKMGKAKKIALSRLLKGAASMSHLTDQDRSVCRYIRSEASRWEGTSYHISNPKVLEILIGHPMIFSDEKTMAPLDLLRREPELTLSEVSKSKIKINLWPEINIQGNKFLLMKDSPTRYFVVPIGKNHLKIAQIIGNEGLTLPKTSKDRTLKSLAALSSTIRVQSQIDGDALDASNSIPADSSPILHLLPQQDGLIAELFVQPVKPDGDHYHPAKGGKIIFSRGQKENRQSSRDFDEEIKKVQNFIDQCPSLTQSQNPDRPYIWILGDPESSLNLLVELQQLPADTVEVLWPKGETFNLRGIVSSSNFKLSLNKQKNNWLEASGELEVDDELVLDMKEIMLLLEEQQEEKFLKLSNGQFLALSKSFRQKLDDLRLLSSPGKDGMLKMHSLAALALEELADEKQNHCNAAWKKHLEQLKEIKNFEAKLPSTLQAELRPYQLEGFHWLTRLAEWGAGACLADDMGLGKTVQAIALLLHRAADGPALIVAPTSVAANWMNEIIRFAPSLNTIRFAGRQNAGLLKKLKPRDMVITTYGMLQQNDNPITEIDWHTVVLDEAQAIKNRSTNRSKAAKELKAHFRIITTGTPIENHLGELHNLFDFINPGLLGSAESFRARFTDPIALYQDAQARTSLQRIVRPFILRRLKNEVLKDLPPRTEITLDVEMSEEESAFYEALRQNAVENLSEPKDDDENAGKKSFLILAEITRLRQACCNPSMVQEHDAPESSKLQVFTDTVSEILEGNHKVLVFSQFVSHLAILKQRLEDLNISYQYLDGSVSAKKRQQSIDDFQNGEGDVFLISLKAGGSGLNLTAADYVIHMDPWWNPAVEDQASDRAHRIGQQRPVTIYRLVTKNTIEEKIVALHHQKRDLADSLLSGADQATRLSAEDMLKLIQEA